MPCSNAMANCHCRAWSPPGYHDGMAASPCGRHTVSEGRQPPLQLPARDTHELMVCPFHVVVGDVKL